MTTVRHHLLRLLALALAAVPASALGQSLAELAPPDAVVAVGFDRPAAVEGDLADALAALDWQGARATLATLLAAAGDDVAEELDLEIFEALDSLGALDAAFEELAAACPAVPADARELRLGSLLDASLGTLSMSRAQPFPTVTVVGRVSADDATAFAALYDALADCFASAELEQDGVSIAVFEQGSDLPFAAARLDDLYVLASTPDAVRAAIRRHAGSGEASLADHRLFVAAERLAPTGFGFAIDFAAIADVAEGFLGLDPADTVDGYVQRRLFAAARTVGGIAMRIGVTEEGLLSETVVAVDRGGGDEALADLLLCTTCGVSSPFLAPADSSAVTSQHVPVHSLVAYVQGWLDGIGEITGDELDLRTLLDEAAGLDLDAALLDWVGTQVHVVTLEAFAPSVPHLVYQPPMALMVPVASAEAAHAGLAALGAALEPLAARALGGTSPVAAALLGSAPADGADGAGAMFASRNASYRGVEYTRVQVGLAFDLGVAIVGNTLVLATPSHAVHDVIDVYEGASNILGADAYRRAADDAPPGATAVSYQHVGEGLRGIAELGHALAQPAAALLSLGLQAAIVETDTGSMADMRPPTPMAYGELQTPIEGTLTRDDLDQYGGYSDRYLIRGAPAGARLRITASSTDFDTYLYVTDPDGAILDQNDDFDGSDSALTFATDGGDFVIEVTSFGGDSTGDYTLAVRPATAADLPTIDLEGVEPRPLEVPATVQTLLFADDTIPSSGAVAHLYELRGLPEDEWVLVEVTSEEFDTYLRLVDASASTILAENDDDPDTSRSAIEFAPTGGPLWVQVTSWSEFATGEYTLTVAGTGRPAAAPEDAEGFDEPQTGESTAAPTAASDAPAGSEGAQDADGSEVSGEDADPVDPPSFAELLGLVEILPDAVAVLAERVGLATGYAQVDGDVIYRRSLVRIDW